MVIAAPAYMEPSGPANINNSLAFLGDENTHQAFSLGASVTLFCNIFYHITYYTV